MAPEPEQQAWPDPRYAWYVIGVLMLAYTLSFIDRQIMSLLVGPVRADLNINDTQFSLLHGLAFGLFYTLMGLPLGRVADRGNRRMIIVLGIAAWSVMTAVCGLARNFWQLFAARIGVGVGEAALSPAAYSLIADYFPPSKLGRAISAYSMGVYLGAGLAYIIGGVVINLVSTVPEVSLPLIGVMRSWQVTFFVVGVPGLLVALLALSVREPVRRGMLLRGGAAAPHVSLGELFRFLWSQRRVFGAHFVGFSLLAMLFNAVTAWTPAFFIRKFDYTAPEIGLALGAIILVFGSSGIIVGGWFGDYLRARGYRDAPMRAAAIGALALTPFAATATLMSDPIWSLALFCPLMFFSSFPFGLAAAGLQMVTPNQMRGQVSAMYLFAVNLLGIASGPTIAALLTDYVFKSDSLVGYSLAIVAGVSAPLAAVVLLTAFKPFERALEAKSEK